MQIVDYIGVPKGIRTPVTAVKGRCPGPLDDGDADWTCRAGRGRLHGSRLMNNVWGEPAAAARRGPDDPARQAARLSGFIRTYMSPWRSRTHPADRRCRR